VIYDEDSHFGSVYVIDTDQYQQPELLSSQRIDSDTFSDLSAEQRTKRLASLNIQNVFLKKPDLSLLISMSLMSLLNVSLEG